MDKKVLIIDDNEHDGKAMKKVLNKIGITKVVLEKTGEKGVERAAKEKPDLVIIDTVLPGINGFEVCRRIRQINGIKPKIVVLTGNVDAVDVDEAESSGVDDYIVKTLDYSLLAESVIKLI